MAEPFAPSDLPRALRRRAERLVNEIERVTSADRKFFERHTHRSHRVRLMSRPERQKMALLIARDTTPPVGKQWAVAVRQVAPGARMRVYVPVPIGGDLDLPEETCRRIYELATSILHQAQEIEAGMVRAMAEKRP